MKLHFWRAAALLWCVLVPLTARAGADFLPLPDVSSYLTPGNLERLEKGEVVQQNVVSRDAKGNDQVRGVALILIRADKERILSVLEAYETYPAWRSNMTSTRVIRREGGRAEVEFELSVMFSTIRYTAIYQADPARGTLQWRLDARRPRQNIEDTVGAWVVRPLRKGVSILAFTIQVRSGTLVPKFVQERFSRSSLPSSLEGVRRRVEGR